MSTSLARARSDNAFGPSARTICHAFSTISSFVASCRWWRRSRRRLSVGVAEAIHLTLADSRAILLTLFGFTNTTRKKRCSMSTALVESSVLPGLRHREAMGLAETELG